MVDYPTVLCLVVGQVVYGLSQPKNFFQEDSLKTLHIPMSLLVLLFQFEHLISVAVDDLDAYATGFHQVFSF